MISIQVCFVAFPQPGSGETKCSRGDMDKGEKRNRNERAGGVVTRVHEKIDLRIIFGLSVVL